MGGVEDEEEFKGTMAIVDPSHLCLPSPASNLKPAAAGGVLERSPPASNVKPAAAGGVLERSPPASLSAVIGRFSSQNPQVSNVGLGLPLHPGAATPADGNCVPASNPGSAISSPHRPLLASLQLQHGGNQDAGPSAGVDQCTGDKFRTTTDDNAGQDQELLEHKVVEDDGSCHFNHPQEERKSSSSCLYEKRDCLDPEQVLDVQLHMPTGWDDTNLHSSPQSKKSAEHATTDDISLGSEILPQDIIHMPLSSQNVPPCTEGKEMKVKDPNWSSASSASYDSDGCCSADSLDGPLCKKEHMIYGNQHNVVEQLQSKAITGDITANDQGIPEQEVATEYYSDLEATSDGSRTVKNVHRVLLNAAKDNVTVKLQEEDVMVAEKGEDGISVQGQYKVVEQCTSSQLRTTMDGSAAEGQEVLEQEGYIVVSDVTTDEVAVENQERELQSAGDLSRATRDKSAVKVNEKVVDREDIHGKHVVIEDFIPAMGDPDVIIIIEDFHGKHVVIEDFIPEQKHLKAAMGDPDVIIIIEENTADPFGHMEQQLRDLFARHPHAEDLMQDYQHCDVLTSFGPHPMLEGQTNALSPTRWIHTKLQLSKSLDWVMLIMRADNVYVKGFANERNGDCFCYEITEPAVRGKPHGHRLQILPPEYKSLPLLSWDVKYIELMGCNTNEELEELFASIVEDPSFVTDAIRCLSSYVSPEVSDDNEAKRKLGGITFLLCEFIRMKLRESREHLLDKVHHWKDICRKLRTWRENGYKNWDPKGLLKGLGITCPEDALKLDYLVLNRSKQYLLDIDRCKRKKSSTKGGKDKSNDETDRDRRYWKDDDSEEAPTENRNTVPLGRRRVQILSIDANFAVCAINMYDCSRGQSIYFLKDNNQMDVWNLDGTYKLNLIGPCRPIGAYDSLGIEVFSECDERCASIRTVWPLPDSDDDDEPKICFTRVEDKYSDKTVNISYLLIPNTIEARVAVRLDPKSDEDFEGKIFGTISARVRGYGPYRAIYGHRDTVA